MHVSQSLPCGVASIQCVTGFRLEARGSKLIAVFQGILVSPPPLAPLVKQAQRFEGEQQHCAGGERSSNIKYQPQGKTYLLPSA